VKIVQSNARIRALINKALASENKLWKLLEGL